MRSRLSLFAMLGMLLAGSVLPARLLADAQTYSTVRRQVRAGVLTGRALDVPTPNGPQPENPNPHLFFVADSYASLKPTGMEFLNPLAPSVITNSIYQRWLLRVRNAGSDAAFNAASPLSQVFQVGAKITKNMGAYWEVNLDTVSTDDLRQFDILYLCSNKPRAAFTAENREKLRKFVEGGGTLWIESAGLLSFDDNAPFLFDINVSSGANASATAVIAAVNHPLLSYPYPLSAQEVQRLGDKNVNDYYVYAPDPASPNGGGPGPNAINPPGAQTLVPVVWNTRGSAPAGPVTPSAEWRPYILAGQVGSGHLIYSAQDSGTGVNDYVGGNQVGYGANSGAISGENFAAASPADLKFLYNIASWTGAHQTDVTNVRRTASTDEKVGAALLEKWRMPPYVGAPARVGGAALYKGVIYAVDGSLVLHAFDSKPGQDLDADGNPDEGMPDYIGGTPYDELWRFDLKTVSGGATGALTPTVIEFYHPGFSASGAPAGLVNFDQRELVVVTLSDGSVVAVRALPRAAAPNFPLAPVTFADWVVPPGTTGATDFGIGGGANLEIPGSAWSEGVLFVPLNTTSGGRIVALDPKFGKSAFYLTRDPASTAPAEAMVPDAPGMPSIHGSLTVGYVHDIASGASEKMVYAYTDRLATGLTQNLPDAIRAVPFGVKSEPLTRQSPTQFVSRAILPWFVIDPAAPADRNPLLRQRVYATYRDPATSQVYSLELRYTAGAPAGNDYTYLYVAGQPGRITVGATITFAGLPPVVSSDTNLTFFADYTLDWSPTVAAKVNARTVMPAPDITASGAQIGGPAMLSPEDILYYTVETPTSGVVPGRGVLFAVREQSANRTSVKWAFTMHNGFNIPVDGQNILIPPRLRQMNIPTAAATGTTLGTYLQDVQFFGTPAYRDGVIYAVGRGSIGAGGPTVSLICAFRANPEIVLRLNAKIDPGTLVRVRQPNPVNTQGAAVSWVELNPQQYTIDYDSGLIRITSMALPGTVTNFASTSLPFVVKVGNGPEQLLAGTQIDTIGATREARAIGPDGVDNLLWFAVVPETIPIGGSLTAPGRITSSPSIQGDILWVGTQNGYVMSFDADPGATDPTAQASGAQIKLVDDVSPTTLVHLRWVQRVAQNPVNGAILGAPGGTANVMAINMPEGIAAFENTLTVIADNKRLIEVDSAGDTVWVCDGTRSYGVAGGELPRFVYDGMGNVVPVNGANATGVAVVQKVAFARPSVARRIGLNDLIVVDTGNNRVAQIDRGGNIIWEVNRLQDEFKTLLRQGDPLSLTEPTDCSYWTEFVPNLNVWLASANPAMTYGAGPGFVVHYLIADTGNFRVIELVDVIDAGGRIVRPLVSGTPAAFTLTRQVNFVSSTYAIQGQRYRYRTMQRLVMRNGDLPTEWQAGLAVDAVRLLTLTLVSNFRLVGDTDPAKRQAFNNFGDTAQSSGGSLVLLNEQGQPLSIVSNLRVPNGAGGFTLQPINNPTWLTKFDEVVGGVLVYKYLMADANGCYQMSPGVDASGKPVMNVEWLLTADDYYRMTGKRLLAASIRRLSTAVTVGPNTGLHRFLISNRFSGSDDPTVFGITYNTTGAPANGNISGVGEFRGEVFELDPQTFNLAMLGHGYVADFLKPGDPGFDARFLVRNPLASIVWRTPSESPPAPGIAIGTVRRFIGSTDRATTTSVLEQPAFADRPF